MPSTKRPQGASDGFCTAGVLVAGPEGIWADPEAFGEPVKAAAAGGGTWTPGPVGASPGPPEADPETPRGPVKVSGAGGGTWEVGLVGEVDDGAAMAMSEVHTQKVHKMSTNSPQITKTF